MHALFDVDTSLEKSWRFFADGEEEYMRVEVDSSAAARVSTIVLVQYISIYLRLVEKYQNKFII